MPARKQRLVPGKLREPRRKVLVESEAQAVEAQVMAGVEPEVDPLSMQPNGDVPERTDHARADTPRHGVANDHEVRARLLALHDRFKQEMVHVRYCVRFLDALKQLETEMVQLEREAAPLMRKVA